MPENGTFQAFLIDGLMVINHQCPFERPTQNQQHPIYQNSFPCSFAYKMINRNGFPCSFAYKMINRNDLPCCIQTKRSSSARHALIDKHGF